MNKISSKTLTVMTNIAKNTNMKEVNYTDTLAFLKERSIKTQKINNELTKNGCNR